MQPTHRGTPNKFLDTALALTPAFVRRCCFSFELALHRFLIPEIRLLKTHYNKKQKAMLTANDLKQTINEKAE